MEISRNKLLLSFLFLISSCYSHILSVDEETVLESPKMTDWGKWGPFETCPAGTLVTGFQLKVQAKHPDIDNTALNGVTFSCEALHRPDYAITWISSSVGEHGTARAWKYCDSYATGFQLKSQRYQGRNRDDAAAVNLKIICAEGAKIEGYEENGDYFKDSEYTQAMICPDKTAVCGLQTQVEKPRYFDSTSLNNIRIKCCPLKSQYFTNSTEIPEVTVAPETGLETSTVDVTAGVNSTQQGETDTTPIIIEDTVTLEPNTSGEPVSPDGAPEDNDNEPES